MTTCEVGQISKKKLNVSVDCGCTELEIKESKVGGAKSTLGTRTWSKEV